MSSDLISQSFGGAHSCDAGGLTNAQAPLAESRASRLWHWSLGIGHALERDAFFLLFAGDGWSILASVVDLQIALAHRDRVAAFQRRHRVGLVTLLFSDIVGSTQLKQELGDREGVALIQRHHELVREILREFRDAEEISTAGDSFFLVLAKPSDAVKFSLLLQPTLRALAKESGRSVFDRIGILVGEVFIEELEGSARPKDLYGLQVDACARLMALGKASQILMSRFAFDNARQVLREQDLSGVGHLCWLNHGRYVLKGVEEPLEVCEVGEAGKGALSPPPTSEKARRHASVDEEPVLGWRPALEQVVPNTQWVLERKLGEGGFGEVWLGRHETLKERRVFKFCFRADRVRSLKREVTLFRLLKESVGHHPNIVGIQEVFFDAPPFYIVMDYAEATDLRAWCEAQGGVEKVPLPTRLEIVAQVADALQAAHEAGVIHRDVKPSNILVSQPSTPLSQLTAMLTDFGIGQVVSQEALAGLTKMGFTETMLSPGSSSQAGTHLYMAPELLGGQPASARSDIYSLGVVLYQLLIGDFRKPLTTDWSKRISDPILRQDLEKCFAGHPEERFSSARELANGLRSMEERRKARAAREKAARNRRILRQTAVAALIVGGIVILAIYAFKHHSDEMKGTTDAQAQIRYDRGKAHLLTNTRFAGLTNAISEFQEAIRRDTNYARAYAALASAYRQLDGQHEPGKGWDAKADEAVKKAFSLDPGLADAFVVRGALLFSPAKGWDAEGDVRNQREALKLDPKVKGAHFQLAFVFHHLGFLDEAVAELDKELSLYHSDPGPLWLKGGTLILKTNYDEASQLLNSVPTEAFPSPVSAAWERGICLFYQRSNHAALAHFESVLKEFPGVSLLISAQAIIYAASGETNTALEKINIAKSSENPFIHFHHSSYHIASAYALMHDYDQAMYWLKRSADEGFPCYEYFEKDPNLDNLRTNEPFKAFMIELKKKWESYQKKFGIRTPSRVSRLLPLLPSAAVGLVIAGLGWWLFIRRRVSVSSTKPKTPA